MDYIPDFFYLSNGQFNWDAINTIANSFLVLSLVCITWWYARQVYKQTNLMIKSNKRNIILDYIQNFLWPISKQLKSEISNIKKNEFNWYQSNGKSRLDIDKLSDIRTGEGFSKNDVFRERPYLEKLFSDRDGLLDELLEVYEEIKETLEVTIQINCLKDLIEQFNRDQKEELKLKDDALIDPIKYFMPYLINYESNKKPSYDGRTNKFLDEFGDKIFSNCFIEKTKLKELHEAKQSKLNQLIEQNRKTLEMIQQIIAGYRQEYYISENEIVGLQYRYHIIV